MKEGVYFSVPCACTIRSLPLCLCVLCWADMSTSTQRNTSRVRRNWRCNLLCLCVMSVDDLLKFQQDDIVKDALQKVC